METSGLAAAALRVLTGAGGATEAGATATAEVCVLVEDRLRATPLGAAALTKLRQEPGAASMSIAQSVLADELARDGAFSALLTDRLLQLLGPEALGVYGSAPTTTPHHGSPTVIVMPPAPVAPPASGPRRATAWWVFLLGLPQFLVFFVLRLGLDTVNDGTSYQTAAPYLLLLLASITMAVIGLLRGLFAFRRGASGLLVVGTLLDALVLILLWQLIPSDLQDMFRF